MMIRDPIKLPLGVRFSRSAVAFPSQKILNRVPTLQRQVVTRGGSLPSARRSGNPQNRKPKKPGLKPNRPTPNRRKRLSLSRNRSQSRPELRRAAVPAIARRERRERNHRKQRSQRRNRRRRTRPRPNFQQQRNPKLRSPERQNPKSNQNLPQRKRSQVRLSRRLLKSCRDRI